MPGRQRLSIVHLLGGILWLAVAETAGAYFSKDLSFGVDARRQGMAGIASAGAPDTSLISWSPGLLGFARRGEMTSTYSNVLDSDINYFHSSVIMPIGKKPVVGLGWEQREYACDTPVFMEKTYSLAFGWSMMPDQQLSIGMVAKYYEAEASAVDVGGDGIGVDWGLAMHRPIPGSRMVIQLDFAVLDLASSLSEPDGDVHDLPVIIRGGVSLAEWDSYSVGVKLEHLDDADDRSGSGTFVRIGGECWTPDGKYAFRAGYSPRGSRNLLTLGVSGRISNFIVTYALSAREKSAYMNSLFSVSYRPGKSRELSAPVLDPPYQVKPL